MKKLPAHVNVVNLHAAFVQDMPALADALLCYPMALPERLNPDGCGRNKTLFLVMDRYRWTLRQYLACHRLSFQQSLQLFTQLTEAVLHINKHQVAHRYTVFYFSYSVQFLIIHSLPYVTDILMMMFAEI